MSLAFFLSLFLSLFLSYTLTHLLTHYHRYTSGSTGKPKGVAHTTGGYLVHAALSTKSSFDIHEGDVYACVADCGWITGHTYIVYGPLCLGTTSLMFESIPTYPNPYRYWDVVQRHKVTQVRACELL